MLAVPADRLPAALGDLDPGNRALLDLSLRRGVSDAEIGELLRKEPGDVARGRDAVLELLADALDVGGHDRRERVREAVAALPDDAWRASPCASPPPPRDPAAEPEPPDEPQPPTRARIDSSLSDDRAKAAGDRDDDSYFAPEPRRSRRGLLVVLLLLGVIAAIGAVLLASGGDDDDEPSSSDGGDTPPAQTDGGKDEGRTEPLVRLGDGRGEGRIAVTDEGATITLRGLPAPDGAYQVWLYDSIVDAQSLGTVSGGSGRVQVKLPADARSYRFVDVSREPADGNPNHSGESVLRAPLGSLLGG
jgi:hypothetical protein